MADKRGKYVITGAASCGKTTLINELKQRGFPVLKEVARGVLEERKHIPISQEECIERQCIMLARQIQQESNADGLTFLDRGVCDIVAYSKHLVGFIPQAVKNTQLDGRYSAVFILDRLPFEHDGLRVERGDDEAEEIHKKIILAYKEYNYSIINVPVFPEPKQDAIRQRADYILNKI